MMGWVIGLVAASGMVAAHTQSVVNYVEALPPRPDQSQIICHDATWETANLVAVENSKVHKKLAPFIEKLLNDARASGTPLMVTVGYRSCDFQLNLRKLNCGLGNYNLYEKPSSQCSPPTEPAGKSLHNEGLALDFGCQGYGLIASSPCFKWLQNNAGKYHLVKHSIEPWHWSTTGK